MLDRWIVSVINCVGLVVRRMMLSGAGFLMVFDSCMVVHRFWCSELSGVSVSIC